MKKEKKKRGLAARLLLIVVNIIIIVIIAVLGANLFVIKKTENKIAAEISSADDSITAQEVSDLKAIKPDCIMVLGASVHADGTPSLMLKDRLDVGIELYKKGVAPKLLLSGDNGQVAYNEVEGMKKYAEEAGVKSEDIFLDHAGFSTYESVYRAKYIFEVKSMIVVTQRYHLYRALYGCESMGIDSLGAAADQAVYRGQNYREFREVLARDKDLVKWMFKPDPTFLGDTIPISGTGIESH